MLKNPTLVGQYVRNRLLPALRSYLTMLPEPETEAIAKLSGAGATRTEESITSAVLEELGHVTPSTWDGEGKRPRGRPPKAKED